MSELLNDVNMPIPGIVFLDVNMPDKNGYDCVIEMKQYTRLSKIPIVIYSTCFQEFVASVLYNMGTYFYIKKQVGFQEIKSIVQKALCFKAENNYSPT